MQYRRGYDNSGLVLTQESDYPMWFRTDLTSAKPIQLFNVGGGPNAISSLTTPNKIDQTTDFHIERIEFNLQRTDHTPLVAADMSLIGLLLRDYWVQIYTNQTRRSWMAHLGAIIKFPMAVAAAGASAYDPANVVNGGCYINVEDGLVISGGEAFIMNINSEIPADDLTGLTMLAVLWGRLYNSERAKVG